MPKTQNHNNQQNTKITPSKKCKDSLQRCKETLQWHQSFGLAEQNTMHHKFLAISDIIANHLQKINSQIQRLAFDITPALLHVLQLVYQTIEHL